MKSAPMSRVTKSHPCPICQHGDWCLTGEKYVLCMRATSPKPKFLKNGETGWLHQIGDAPKPVRRQVEKPRVTIDAAAMMREFKQGTCGAKLVTLANSLGVCAMALAATGCAWASPHNAYAFPMYNGAREIVGIRMRHTNGSKWAIEGSQGGIFWPEMEPNETAYVLEGPTDLAAAMTIGLYGFGRPSCSSGGAQLLAAIARTPQIKRVVIISDNDNKRRLITNEPYSPGLDGARNLQKELHLPSCIFIPPAKDFRAYVQAGGTRELLESSINQLVWKKGNRK